MSAKVRKTIFSHIAIATPQVSTQEEMVNKTISESNQ